MFSTSTFADRRRALRAAMGDATILLIGHRMVPRNYPHNTYPFRQNSHVLYYCGISRPDVALVMGANDICNPAARTAEGSPIYGMPILDVDQAAQVIVIKRSMSPGFAGISNELFVAPNCAMLFGDGKQVAEQLVETLSL